MVKKVFTFLVLFSFLPLSALAQVDPGFNANKLIEDNIFIDIQTFGGAEGVQKFLEVKNSVLADTSSNFLQKLKEPNIAMLKEGLEDPHPNLGRLRSAAELIWDVSVQSGLNPQVILVTLQKEQGLITNHKDSTEAELQKALDHAMGFACPDDSGCGDLFPGFYFQLFGNFDSSGNRYLGAAKSLIKSYNYPGGRGPMVNGTVSRVGDSILIENTQGQPYNAPANQMVSLLNKATAALYRYTPHVFNGNYNFWKFFTAWFKYPNGTLVALANDIKTYIIQNGTKQLVPEFVAQARGLVLGNKITVSPTEFESYPTDKVYGPADNTVVKVTDENKLYVFENNIKHPASNFVITQRGLNAQNALSITSSESVLFENGSVLTPKEGTILKAQSDPAVYLVQNGRLKLFSEYTFKQKKVALSNIVLMPDEEVVTYERQGFVAPLDGTLVSYPETQTVYLVDQGLKRPLTAELFKNLKLSFKNVVKLSKDEVVSLPIGAYASPKDITWLANSKTGDLYLFKEGSLHKISAFVAKQRHITPDYHFGPDEIFQWQEGIPYPPTNGTLITGSTDKTVYLVQNGQLKGLTAKAFKNRKYSFKKVVTLPQDEVNAYAKGEVIIK